MKKSQLIIRHLIAVLITVVIAAIAFYVTLPAINPHSMEFWSSFVTIAVVFGVVDLIATKTGKRVMEEVHTERKKFKLFQHPAFAVPVIVVIAAVVVVPAAAVAVAVAA